MMLTVVQFSLPNTCHGHQCGRQGPPSGGRGFAKLFKFAAEQLVQFSLGRVTPNPAFE